MKQHVEIIYNKLEKNEKYDEIITKVINECFAHEKMDMLNLYISVTLTIPDEIHELNKKYRNVDRATDVLSFPMFEKNEIKQIIKEGLITNEKENYDILGDLVISIPKVYEQAKDYGHSFERELSYMCVHGFYHLMGYDHIEEEDKIVMRKKEDEILNTLGITRD